MVVGGFVGVTGVIRGALPVHHSVLSAHHPTDYLGQEVESPRPFAPTSGSSLVPDIYFLYLVEINVSHWLLYCLCPVLCVCVKVINVSGTEPASDEGQMFWSVKNGWRCSPPLESSLRPGQKESVCLSRFSQSCKVQGVPSLRPVPCFSLGALVGRR